MTADLRAIARPAGTLAMVAMDQRESLRTMLRDHGHEPSDERVRAFKLSVARELAGEASGLLIEPEHADAVAPLVAGGLIVAVDGLVQEPGGPVEETWLREPDGLPAATVAVKLLVIWLDDARRALRMEMARRFVALARARGLLSVLEGVVRDDREIEAAAAELGATGPSLYKCQVPFAGRAAPASITRRAEAIDATLSCPWVVLSQGVDPEDFPAAVAACCDGGASGLLAGRAVWTPALADADPAPRLRGPCLERLRELGRIADAHGRPVT